MKTIKEVELEEKVRELQDRIEKVEKYLNDSPQIIKSMYFNTMKKDEETLFVFLNATFIKDIIDILKGKE